MPVIIKNHQDKEKNMKKLRLIMLALICIFTFAVGVGFCFGSEKVSADTISGETPIIGKTVFKISKSKDAFLLATPIKNYSDVYEIGYDVTATKNDEDFEVNYKSQETAKFYSYLKLGNRTWTAGDIFGDSFDGAAMIVWEMEYDKDATYNMRAYAKVCRYDGEVKYIPASEEEVKVSGEKEYVLSSTYTLHFENGEEEFDDQVVTYGEAIGTLPAITPKAGYTAEWKIGDVSLTAETTWQAYSDKTAVATYTANTNTAYTVKFYTNTPEHQETFTEQTEKQLNLTGTTDTTAEYTGNVSALFPGYILDVGNSTISGTIAGNGGLELEVYCAVNLREVSTYSEFATAVNEDDTYIILTADLTYSKSTAAQFETFSGVIDGNGYEINTINLGNASHPSYSNSAFSLFIEYKGILKNIGFYVNYYGALPTYYARGDYPAHWYNPGSIACVFNGYAENVLLKSRMIDYYKAFSDARTSGIMFGELKSNAEVRNCVIECVPNSQSKYPCPSDACWIAAVSNSSAIVENVHVIDSCGKNLAWAGSGISQSSDCVVGNAETVAEAVVYSFDDDAWYCDGVTAPLMLNEGNRSTYVRTKVEVSTFAGLVSAIRTNNNAHILLTNDITYDNNTLTTVTIGGNAVKVISESFSGIIDGQGHTFDSISLNAGNGSDMRLFRFFSGTIRNINLVASMQNGSGQSSAAGVIALEFSGKAYDIKLTLSASQVYMKNGYDTQQSGGLFGRLANGAFVKNVFIDFTPAAGDSNVSGFGFVAGFVKENASVTVKNVVVVNRGSTVRPIIALAYNTSTINGVKPSATTRYHSSEANANTMNGTIITNALVGNEATVIANASTYLGASWVCDGTGLPCLKSSVA